MSDKVSTNDERQHTIRTEKRGSTLVVTINRPETKNALDSSTAAALAETFRAFDSDESLAVAVLTGSGRTFCSGFDLKALADGAQAPRVSEEGNGPLGVTRMQLSKPVICRSRGLRGSRGTRNCALVRSASGG